MKALSSACHMYRVFEAPRLVGHPVKEPDRLARLVRDRVPHLGHHFALHDGVGVGLLEHVTRWNVNLLGK